MGSLKKKCIDEPSFKEDVQSAGDCAEQHEVPVSQPSMPQEVGEDATNESCVKVYGKLLTPEQFRNQKRLTHEEADPATASSAKQAQQIDASHCQERICKSVHHGCWFVDGLNALFLFDK